MGLKLVIVFDKIWSKDSDGYKINERAFLCESISTQTAKGDCYLLKLKLASNADYVLSVPNTSDIMTLNIRNEEHLHDILRTNTDFSISDTTYVVGYVPQDEGDSKDENI